MAKPKPTNRKCPECGEAKSPGALYCDACWRRVPEALRRSFRAARSRKERVDRANAMHRWFTRQHPEHYASYLSVDDQRRMHFDVVEFLAAQGVADTAENRDMVVHVANELFAKEFPGIRQNFVERVDMEVD